MSRRRREHDPARQRAVVGAAGLVAAVLDARGATRVVRERRLLTEWRRIVGERVADRAWPTSLQGDVLHVRVANSAWLHELTFVKEAMLRAIAERVGAPVVVREIKLHLPGRGETLASPRELQGARGAAQRAPLALRPPVHEVPRAIAERIDAETGKIQDPELRDAMRTLRRHLGG
jgi:predicted nucleic acid-binding Zn ribbon protein